MNRWHAFGQLILSRFREFYREPEAIFWVYGFPIILAVVLGIATGGEPVPVKVDIQGTVGETAAEAMARLLREERMEVEIHNADECQRRLTRRRTDLFVIPASAPASSAGSSTPAVKYVYDTARAESVLARHTVEEALLRSRAGAGAPTEELISEPGSRYIDFLLPGLIGMNVMGGGLFGVGFVLVDMRVRKLFKRLLATPMNRRDFLLSILTARMTFLLPEMLSLLLIGHFMFHVPIKGNVLVLAITIIAGAITFSSLGLLIGSRTEKTETASGLMNMVMLPMYLLSGVFFSSKKFPDAMQPLIQALPLTQLNDALRDVMLDGAGLGDIAWHLGILLAWAAATFPLALRWFRWR
jgi:ABC-type multidrug transport system permease subunit